MPDETPRITDDEWPLLVVLRRHVYEDWKRHPSGIPGLHACTCGWEGYWCDYQPHVARELAKVSNAGAIARARAGAAAVGEELVIDLPAGSPPVRTSTRPRDPARSLHREAEQ